MGGGGWGREEGWEGVMEGGRDGGRERGRGGMEGRGSCYTYSNIIQWHHSI